MSIDFACPKCKKKYRVKEELAGKAAKCAKCEHRMKIPLPVPVAKPEPELEPDLSDLFDEDFAATAMSGEVVDSPKSNPARKSFTSQCPSCGTGLTSDDVLCVSCGYDLRSGSRHKTKRIKPSKTSEAVKQTATLLQGIVFSAIGAALGAAVWIGIAIATEYEISYIALGLGAAAGVGMAIGKGDDTGEFSGIIAAAISLLGILLARLGIAHYFGMTLADLFRPIDGLLGLLAAASAYKIGSGQAED